MSITAVDYTVRYSHYTGARKAIHVVIAIETDEESGLIAPDLEDLGTKAHATPAAVADAIAEMCADGYLDAVDDGTYRFLTPSRPQIYDPGTHSYLPVNA